MASHTRKTSAFINSLRIIMPIIAIVCLILFVPWLAGCAYLSPLPDTVQEQVDKAVNYDLDGVIVYVDKKGQAPQFYSAGWKNRENKIPADPHALFKIASISKLYIAAAAAKLVSSKSLALDKTLADYLPELKGRIQNADKITLKMMLQHRSGIPNYIDDPKFPWANLPRDVDGLLKYGLDKPADFNPDSRYKYSNTNYLLIGMILDKVLGYSHHQYIKNEILDPLKLTHTFSLLSEVDLKDVVSGYFIGYVPDLKTANHIGAGGSMIATAQDVGIFLRALNDGSLLNKEEQKIYSSIYVYEHTGLLPGYSSIARYHKDIDTVVIQFVNTSGGNSWMITEIIYNRIIRILHQH
ncbi:serine-type D-Ala-D-Ala carboxypeptidase [Cellvibrio zantedeschiae]|uniref:Serine-type D-Ala-D-Ala carboxypeptidase n=1 Tax=Cellvibrio zantedeschiae TaxID=1237077 RepID=A0ABQ3B5D8_9GAMM|nr:serine hydrolase domain-containing protein [Cellvibrio zantedeschiae]GGY79026.1 serine-type D-Ala-D-Ala carboxypeptidase [Cellvibrio zantedeschiae]